MRHAPLLIIAGLLFIAGTGFHPAIAQATKSENKAATSPTTKDTAKVKNPDFSFLCPGGGLRWCPGRGCISVKERCLADGKLR